MIPNDSRYTAAAHESAVCHLYSAAGIPETVSVTNQVFPLDSESTVLVDPMLLVGDPLTEVSRDTTYLLTTSPGDIAPRRYMVKATDNIQLLAYRTLQDPTQWWVLADANPHIRYPFDFVMGKTIHLPE